MPSNRQDGVLLRASVVCVALVLLVVENVFQPFSGFVMTVSMGVLAAEMRRSDWGALCA